MLLPNEWIENSIETYIYQHTTKSQVIYWVVLVVITVTFIALPFIYVDISVQGNGVVRPISEKAVITSSIAEIVDSVYINEGKHVKKGDVILRFQTNNLDYSIDYQLSRLNDYKAHLIDLAYLSKGSCPSKFHSLVCQQEYIYFTKKKNELDTSLAQVGKEYARNKVLFEQKLISDEEYEKCYYHLTMLQNELASLIQSQLSQWQTNLNSYRNLYNEINANIKQDMRDKDMTIVRSPISGTVDEFSGIYKGSRIQTGQSLATISPDSILCVEIYATPKDIGFMSVEMPVNIQIESFNYNEWGTILGKVKDISSDFLLDSKGNAYYKVKCEIERDYLQLKNGKIGKLKKGMAARAHFVITRRSLFSLLYQNIDDWVNPKQYKSDEAKVNYN